MTITPQKRVLYDPVTLQQSGKIVGIGGIAVCVKYEIDGEWWVEKSLLKSKTGEDWHLPWIKNEAEILAVLDSYPQFPRFFGSYVPADAWNPLVLVLMMEYIEGKPLFNYRGEKDTAIRVGYDACIGLEVMKDKEIVHRDLKPDNLLVTNSDRQRVKIIDFGLAKHGKKELAIRGAVFGTPEYMSPEQARGEPVDQNSDLFSLALGLYEIITGSLALSTNDSNNSWSYVRAAEAWNQDDINRAKKKLVSGGVSESLADAWGLAVHPTAAERKLQPLKVELEQLLRRSGSLPTPDDPLDFEIVEEDNF